MFKILNIQSFSYVSQRPVGGIEKHVRTFVILWSYPLPFQDSPMSKREMEEASESIVIGPDTTFSPLFWNEEGVAIGDYDSFFIGDEEYSTSSIIGFKEWFLQVDKYDPYTDIAQFMTEGMEEWINLEYEFAKQIRSMIPKEVGLYYKFLLEIIVFRLLLSLASSI